MYGNLQSWRCSLHYQRFTNLRSWCGPLKQLKVREEHHLHSVDLALTSVVEHVAQVEVSVAQQMMIVAGDLKQDESVYNFQFDSPGHVFVGVMTVDRWSWV